MRTITISNYRRKYRKDIIDICYKTGYLGEDLSGRNIFDDKKMFFLCVCSYYLNYEAQNCFVAVDNNGRAVGYILGTCDSINKSQQYKDKYYKKILLRKLLVTSWKYPESISIVDKLLNNLQQADIDSAILNEYPAHLHINILKEYQGTGLGTRLYLEFEKHLKDQGVKGIHLETSSVNYKAVPFYNKLGYQVLEESKGTFWEDRDDVIAITFGKKL